MILECIGKNKPRMGLLEVEAPSLFPWGVPGHPALCKQEKAPGKASFLGATPVSLIVAMARRVTEGERGNISFP